MAVDTGKAPVAATPIIAAPNFQYATFPVTGTSQYVQHKWDEKVKDEIMAKQRAGSKSKAKKIKEPKDFDALWKAATYRTAEGWAGIPCCQIRSAMIDACRVAGFVMTRAKQAFWVEGDGYDETTGVELVKITNGEPAMFVVPVRLDSGVADMRSRPKWEPGWTADFRIRFDADMLGIEDIANLLLRAGMQAGIGEGRLSSKKSHGMGWGCFELVNQEEVVS